jgi:serine/threonine-protein kinase
MRLFDLEDPMVGKLVGGRYRVVEKLGSGGMGAVYLVREESATTELAMKVLSPTLAADPLQRARFFRESRVAQSIEHDNVVRVLEVGESASGNVFMVLEYLPGGTLADRIAARPLPLSRTVEIGIQIAAGLSRAHGLGVVHRDVKCDNVMFLSRDDEPDHVKLVDFGLAWTKGGAKLTATGQVFGTPEYLSPEQARGDPATPLSDLYSLGIVLYEATCGRVPFEGPATHVMRAHLEEQPPPPSSMNRSARLPERFDRLVLKLLRKEPERRHRDAKHLLDELAALAGELRDSGQEGGR